MESKEIIKNQIVALKEQAQIEKELETGNEIYYEAEIKEYNQVLKDLEQKELLESELKLEKHKVKYLMKQLKKQDEVLEATKKEFYDKLYNWYLLDNMSSLKLDNEPKEYGIIRQWIKQWLEGE